MMPSAMALFLYGRVGVGEERALHGVNVNVVHIEAEQGVETGRVIDRQGPREHRVFIVLDHIRLRARDPLSFGRVEGGEDDQRIQGANSSALREVGAGEVQGDLRGFWTYRRDVDVVGRVHDASVNRKD
ncbi:hypothetical protein BC938DRAFT_474139 [Jimgerdemannia flammicorona]|uniref:Uncharacterized protein n=1 Tax=Jimgerdemannia flammicorona TaxID=994334 RepID=A0A433Q2S4_9FUNG|nr:hypothetical protein BC938DRAFT_474139 [Jimgerdemannia flammicorona]